MKHNASQSRIKKVGQNQNHATMFAKVVDGRKQPVRGLWERNGRFYAQISVEDFSSGLKRVRRVPLANPEGEPVSTAAQAITEINRLRTHRSEDNLPKLGRTPTFAVFADNYIIQAKAGKEKKGSTIEKEEATIALWKNHLGGIRIDKIRPAHVAGMMNKRLAAGMTKRTVKLDIIALRNVLKQARDVDEHIRELPVPPGLSSWTARPITL